jgi:nucleotide-binding universal stress UspA family protein
VLVGVDDSPVSLRALHAALQLCRAGGGVLRAVTVVTDGTLELALQAASAEPRGGERRRQAGGWVLQHAARLASAADVVAETVQVEGEPGAAIIAETASWHADIVVVGRAELVGMGHPYVGLVTQHVLEFSDVPVLVVP